ncbi:MAG: hypothetical protein SOV90_08670 [Lachnospiraceae bacterium]|nr:hypothetical protein [Lachnospiraceae bacterium]
MNTNNNIVTKENNNIERYYTLEQAKEILRNERINKIKTLKGKVKQKAVGLFLIALGIVIPFILNGDATASVIAIPLGVAVIATKDKVVD